MTHDNDPRRTATGLGLAALSAVSFGTSGALAGGMMDAGWSAAGVVTVRVSLAAIALAVPAWIALAGRWSLLRAHARLIVVYGLVAVAGTQLAYFSAIRHMEVGPALLIEYTAPVGVLLWAWFRYGQRPGAQTVVGAVLAAAGLVLVLDLVSGAEVSAVGVTWSIVAMVGAAAYFVLSAGRSELPPIVLAACGLGLGALVLLAAGASGVLELDVSTAPVSYAGNEIAVWVPVLALGLVSAAIAYVSGIAASRRLGSRLASFVALLEVLAALVFARILLDQQPNGVQVLGAVVVMAGVVVVKLGERRTALVAAEPQSSAGASAAVPVEGSSSSVSLPKPATTSLSAPS
jgi:drug/metabolite transporter (DMT)-like permease